MNQNCSTSKINIYNLEEVEKCCNHLKCTPYHLFYAYKEVGGSIKDIRNYIRIRFLKKVAVGNNMQR